MTNKELIKIEERIKRRFAHDWNGSLIDAYIQGATEQLKIDEEEQGKALLYAVHKTTERTKKEMSQKALDLMMHWIFGNAPHEVYDDFMSDYSDLMKTLED